MRNFHILLLPSVLFACSLACSNDNKNDQSPNPENGAGLVDTDEILSLKSQALRPKLPNEVKAEISGKKKLQAAFTYTPEGNYQLTLGTLALSFDGCEKKPPEPQFAWMAGDEAAPIVWNTKTPFVLKENRPYNLTVSIDNSSNCSSVNLTFNFLVEKNPSAPATTPPSSGAPTPVPSAPISFGDLIVPLKAGISFINATFTTECKLERTQTLDEIVTKHEWKSMYKEFLSGVKTEPSGLRVYVGPDDYEAYILGIDFGIRIYPKADLIEQIDEIAARLKNGDVVKITKVKKCARASSTDPVFLIDDYVFAD